MTKPDYRAMCAELAEEVEHLWSIVRDDNNEPHSLAVCARALLAQPEPEGEVEVEDGERLRSLFDATRYQMADALGVDRGSGWTSLAMEISRLKASCTPQPPAAGEVKL